MKKIINILVLGVVLSLAGGDAVATRKVAYSFPDFVDAVAVGRMSEAQAILAALTKRGHRISPEEQALLLGMAHIELGQFAAARTYLAGARGRLPLLADLVHLQSARAAAGMGDTAVAETHLRELLRAYPSSPWRAAAEERLLTLFIADRRWDAAEDLLAAMGQGGPAGAFALAVRRAALLLRRGEIAAAASGLWTLYRRVRTYDAAERLREVVLEYPKKYALFGGIAIAERIALARQLLDRRLGLDAAYLLGDTVPEADPAVRRLMGEALFQARRYPAAKDLLCSAADHAASADREQLLRKCAQAAARADDTPEALRRNRQVLEEFPGTATSAVAQAKIAFLQMDEGHYADAIASYRAWLAMSPRVGEDVADVLWNIAWCHYRLKQWDAALAALDDVAAAARGREWTPRLAYWRGRILEAEGRRAEAKQVFTALRADHGGHYYGRLARGAAPFFFAHGASRAVANPAPLRSPRAQALARLGLWQWALEAEEIEIGAADVVDTVVDRLGLAWQIPPPFIHRIIHQESNYRTDVVSPAGAVGLMQLMPATARRLAEELRLADFHGAELARPLTNLRLGIWYLRKLSRRYHGALPLILAGYNAGEEAVDRWLVGFARRRGGPRGTSPTAGPLDEFVEEIPYSETIRYVKRILQRYWAEVE
ncbi:MAG: lytic transglycosylase domain-containing protein [Deltaproteobacteria bacterium]|nr:lytic transglycosylase domain-containing protein [Deltaproteobacteria bacterium]